MTLHDQLNALPSWKLYHVLYEYDVTYGCPPAFEEDFDRAGDTLSEDETYHDELVEMIETLYNDDLITIEWINKRCNF